QLPQIGGKHRNGLAVRPLLQLSAVLRLYRRTQQPPVTVGQGGSQQLGRRRKTLVRHATQLRQTALLIGPNAHAQNPLTFRPPYRQHAVRWHIGRPLVVAEVILVLAIGVPGLATGLALNPRVLPENLPQRFAELRLLVKMLGHYPQGTLHRRLYIGNLGTQKTARPTSYVALALLQDQLRQWAKPPLPR